MDTIRIQPLAPGRRLDPEYQQLALVINDVPLLDLVRPLEEAQIAQDRALAGADAHESFPVAAAYMYPTRRMLRLYRDAFFGSAEYRFDVLPGDPAHGKVCLLGCECGTPECWPLLVRIAATPEVTTWLDFSHFHRQWSYDLGPFHFDTALYRRALEPFYTPAA